MEEASGEVIQFTKALLCHICHWVMKTNAQVFVDNVHGQFQSHIVDQPNSVLLLKWELRVHTEVKSINTFSKMPFMLWMLRCFSYQNTHRLWLYFVHNLHLQCLYYLRWMKIFEELQKCLYDRSKMFSRSVFYTM